MKRLGMLFAVFMVVCLILGSIGCGGGGETKTVKFGVVLPLSGYLGSMGKDEKAGIEFAVSETNDAGGIKALDGAKLELVTVDDKSDASITASEVERVITEEGVAAVFIGPDEVAQALVAPIADRYKVPVICLGSYDSTVTDKGYEYFWGGIGTSSYPGAALAFEAFIKTVINDYHKTPKTVTLISYQATDMQKGKQNVLLPAIQAAGMTLVLDETYTDQVSSWDAYALKVKQANADMCLAFADPYSESELLKALDRLGYVPPMALWLGLNWVSSRALVGEDVCTRTIDKPGQFTTATMVYGTAYSQGQAFRARYEAVNGAGTYGRPIVGAQAIYLLRRCIQEIKSGDPQKINEELGVINIPCDDPDLIMPPYCPALKFSDKHGLVNQGMIIAQWQNGDCCVIKPFKYGTCDARFVS